MAHTLCRSPPSRAAAKNVAGAAPGKETCLMGKAGECCQLFNEVAIATSWHGDVDEAMLPLLESAMRILWSGGGRSA